MEGRVLAIDAVEEYESRAPINEGKRGKKKKDAPHSFNQLLKDATDEKIRKFTR